MKKFFVDLVREIQIAVRGWVPPQEPVWLPRTYTETSTVPVLPVETEMYAPAHPLTAREVERRARSYDYYRNVNNLHGKPLTEAQAKAFDDWFTGNLDDLDDLPTVEQFVSALKAPNDKALKVVLCHPNAKLPLQATPGSGAYDLFLVEDIEVRPWQISKTKLGIKVQIPEGFAGIILPRSSTGFRDGVDVQGYLDSTRAKMVAGDGKLTEEAYEDISLPNRFGYIDSDYRGELNLALTRVAGFRSDKEVLVYKAGDRVAQLALFPVAIMPLIQVDELDPSPRGVGGIGSTGK